MNQEPLHTRMRRLAAAQAPDVAADLRAKADALEDAADFKHGPKVLLGCWARARRAWCNVTGEDLV